MIQAAKSIEELYEEAKEFDLLITNDAPLNTALNRMPTKPRLGLFASTSRLLGSKYGEILFEEDLLPFSDLVLRLQKESSLSLRETVFYLKRIQSLWEQSGDLKTLGPHLSAKEKEIVSLLEHLPSYRLCMQNMDLSFLDKKEIVVIGKEFFSELDKRVLTLPYTELSPFKEGEHKLETLYLFASKQEIVKQVLSMITRENQDLVAIVLHVESEYLPLLRAGLASRGIGVLEKNTLFENLSVREYFSLLELVYSFHQVRTKELIPIGNVFGLNLDSAYEESFFQEYANVDKKAGMLLKLLTSFREKTFGELFHIFEQAGQSLPKEFGELLHKLGVFNLRITKKNVQDAKFFIENCEEEYESSKQGVVFIDAKNSTYINRDLIFYLGMDESWTRSTDKLLFQDTEGEFERNLLRFEILLQQGKERFFFLPKMNGARQTSPPYYFSFLFGQSVESYSKDFFDICEVVSYQEEKIEEKKFFSSETQSLPSKESISASSLNSFSQCPKKYSYSRLLTLSDKEALRKGKLIHAFAEFYGEHSSFVRSVGIESCVELMLSELKLLSHPFQTSLLKKQFSIACQSIVEFLDSLELEKNLPFPQGEAPRKKEENIFARHFGKKLENSHTEFSFKDSELGIHGVIDLIVGSTALVDYKTGKKKKTVREIVKNASVSSLSSQADFQVLAYLSFFHKFSPEKELDFLYYFPLSSQYERIMRKEDIDDLLRVRYIPCSFLEYLQSDEFLNYFRETSSQRIVEILDILSGLSYFEEKKIPPELLKDSEKLADILFYDFYEHLSSLGFKKTKANAEYALRFLRQLFGIKTAKRNKQKEVFFFREDLEEFHLYLARCLEEIHEGEKSTFPFRPAQREETCKECEFRRLCLKTLEVKK